MGWFVIERIFGDRNRRAALNAGMRTTLERLRAAAEATQAGAPDPAARGR